MTEKEDEELKKMRKTNDKPSPLSVDFTPAEKRSMDRLARINKGEFKSLSKEMTLEIINHLSEEGLNSASKGDFEQMNNTIELIKKVIKNENE